LEGQKKNILILYIIFFLPKSGGSFESPGLAIESPALGKGKKVVMSCVNVCIKGNINMRGITFLFLSYFVNVSNVISKKLLLYEFTNDTTFILHSQYITSRIHMSAFTY